MASTVLYLRKNQDSERPIYLRLSLSRGTNFSTRTPEKIHPSNWGKGKPKSLRGNSPLKTELDTLSENLQELSKFILDQYHKEQNQSEINSKWLKIKVAEFYSPIIEEEQKSQEQLDLEYYSDLTNYLDFFVNKHLPRRTYNGNPVKTRAKQTLKCVANHMLEYQTYAQKKFRIQELNYQFAEDFKSYLELELELNHNTLVDYTKRMKTILRESYRVNIDLSTNLNNIDAGKMISRPPIYLTFEELEQIRVSRPLDTNLQTVKDWLLIGCDMGQRASDLFSMSTQNIEYKNGHYWIQVLQKKTEKTVKIPITQRVLDIIDRYKGEFPPLFFKNIESQKTAFNKYVKVFAKTIGLNRMVEGRKYNHEFCRYDFGEYPLHEVIATHICRRTFCTLNFELQTPISVIMAISGHGTEKMLLTYINKSYDLLAELFVNSTFFTGKKEDKNTFDPLARFAK